MECVNDDIKVLGVHSEWAVFRDMWRDFIWARYKLSVVPALSGASSETIFNLQIITD